MFAGKPIIQYYTCTLIFFLCETTFHMIQATLLKPFLGFTNKNTCCKTRTDELKKKTN